MVVIIAGIRDEAALHAAIRGYPRGTWIMAQSPQQIMRCHVVHGQPVTRVELCGAYHTQRGWEDMFAAAVASIPSRLKRQPIPEHIRIALVPRVAMPRSSVEATA